MKKCKILSFILPFIFSLFLCATSISNPVSALEIGQGSALVLGTGNVKTWSGSTINATKSGDDLVFAVPAGSVTLKDLYFTYSAGSGTAHDYIYSFNVRYKSTSAQDGYLIVDGLLSHTQDVITTSCVSVDNNPVYEGTVLYYQGNNTITCTYWVFSHGDYSSFSSHTGSRIATIYSQVAQSSELIISPGTLRHLSFNSLTADDRAWLDEHIGSSDSTAVVNKLNELLSAQNTTNSALNNLRSDTQAQTQEIEQGNEEAQDRWEADKQEEADREEQGSDDMDDLGSTFHFEIRNPFMGLLGLFTNNCPVSIPTIASMLGSSQTVYPCWFSSQTRGILTPVMGISSSVLLFGYLVHKFLEGGSFNGKVEYK